MDVDKLKAILAAVQDSDVTSLDWADGQERLKLVFGHAPHPPPIAVAAPILPLAQPVSAPVATRAPEPIEPPVTAPIPKKSFTVDSPFVGTFYRSSSPESPAFVDVGSQVQKGQVLCIVEAMKLMNEIEAEQAGRVVEILVPNGAPVEYGEALFRLEPDPIPIR